MSMQPNVFYLLHRVHQIGDSIFRRHTGMFPRQYTALQVIHENPGITQQEFVRISGIDRSTTSKLVERLNSLKQIERRDSLKDLRAYTLTLTETGEELLRNARNPVKEATKHFMNGTEKELSTILSGIIEHAERRA